MEGIFAEANGIQTRATRKPAAAGGCGTGLACSVGVSSVNFTSMRVFAEFETFLSASILRIKSASRVPELLSPHARLFNRHA